jgi:hypothetical protein
MYSNTLPTVRSPCSRHTSVALFAQYRPHTSVALFSQYRSPVALLTLRSPCSRNIDPTLPSPCSRNIDPTLPSPCSRNIDLTLRSPCSPKISPRCPAHICVARFTLLSLCSEYMTLEWAFFAHRRNYDPSLACATNNSTDLHMQDLDRNSPSNFGTPTRVAL